MDVETGSDIRDRYEATARTGVFGESLVTGLRFGTWLEDFGDDWNALGVRTVRMASRRRRIDAKELDLLLPGLESERELETFLERVPSEVLTSVLTLDSNDPLSKDGGVPGVVLALVVESV